MNIDHISPSILHVTATESLNIQDDLTKESDKTIAQLLNEETKTQEQKKENEQTNG